MDVREAVSALRQELGEESIASQAPFGALAIGGRPAELLLAPASPAELGQAVAAAARLGLAVAPVGGGTALGCLAPPVRPYVAVLTGRLSGVVAHAADDMTVTVRAGTTVATLAETLARRKQRLPVDGPCATRATIGGLIATSPAGPLRFGHGTLRDYLLGITVVDAEGRLVRAGGRVVKNVAGYDLMKLHAGARGTLGVVVEGTFKVKPIPDHLVWLVAEGTPAVAESVRTGLAAAQVPAAALELLSAELGAPEGLAPPGHDAPPGAAARFLVAVGLEGIEPEIRWQEGRARAVLAAAGGGEPTVVAGAAASDFLRRLVDFGAEGANDLLVRGAVLASRLPELIAAWSAELPGAQIVAEAGDGVARLRAAAARPAAVTALQRAARGCGGHAVVEAMPAEARAGIDLWETQPHPLAARLKAALDPGSVFLPGSYLGLGALPGAARAG